MVDRNPDPDSSEETKTKTEPHFALHASSLVINDGSVYKPEPDAAPF